MVVRRLETEFHADVVEALATAVVLLDGAFQLVRANAAAQNLLAFSESKVHAQPFSECIADAGRLLLTASRALSEGRSVTERGLSIDLTVNSTATVDCTASPVWVRGAEPAAVVIELTNVEHHQRIQLEGAIAQQNHVSSEVLKGLAHEIKNPLGGIRGAAQLLERELEDQRQAEYTQIIISEVDRLRLLVDRMLGPREGSRRDQLNIHEVVEQVRTLIEAEHHGGTVIVRDYDPSVPVLQADRDQLVQAVLNVVSNAFQCLNGAGQVTLRTRIQRKFTIDGELHKLVVCLQIIDDGPGVSPEIADSIFFPLVSGRADGTGLGLSIAQTLIQRQGGAIGFTSEPGNTVFSIWLPLGAKS